MLQAVPPEGLSASADAASSLRGSLESNEGPGEVDRRGLAPSLSAAKGRMPREIRRKVTASPAPSFRANRKMHRRRVGISPRFSSLSALPTFKPELRMFSRMGAVVSLPTTFRRGDLLWDAPEQTPVCRAPYRRGTKKMYYCVPLRTVPG